MDITLRRESPDDVRKVEALTRAAFWNVYRPGCSEHYLLHLMRDSASFISELDVVAEFRGVLAGSIVYTRSNIITPSGPFETVTFGPVSVLPEYQNIGIGKALISYTLREAARLGHKAVVIFGDPDYYRRFGFRPAEVFNISMEDGRKSPAMQALELAPGALDGAAGRFRADPVFNIDEAEAERFDKLFPYMEKGEAPSQKKFQKILSQIHD